MFTKMKKLICTFALLAPFSALHSETYPNRTVPELTTQDLAQLLNLRVVKGRLPDTDGFRIEAYEPFFRDFDGTLHSLSNGPIKYEYSKSKGGDIGELIIALRDKKEAFEVTLIARNFTGSQETKHRLKKLEDVETIGTQQFRGESGNTVNDLTQIVTIGDNDVFTFRKKDAAPNATPAALVIRAYPKK